MTLQGKYRTGQLCPKCKKSKLEFSTGHSKEYRVLHCKKCGFCNK